MKALLMVTVMALVVSFYGVAFAADVLAPTELGVSFRLPPEEELWPGDIIYVYVEITNPTEETFKDIPLFALWTLGDNWESLIYYWPAPASGHWYAGEVNYYTISVPPGRSEVEIWAPMVWPDCPAANDTATWRLFTGMTDPMITKILGRVDERTIILHD